MGITIRRRAVLPCLVVLVESMVLLLRPAASHAAAAQLLIFQSNQGYQAVPLAGGAPFAVTDSLVGFSPDGQYMLQITSRGGSNYALAVRNLGTGAVRVVDGPDLWAANPAVRWSSDGSLIVLKDNNQTIWTANADGSAPVRATATQAYDSQDSRTFDFSPDKSQLAFLGCTNGSGCDMYVVPRAGGTPMKLPAVTPFAPSGYRWDWAWLADGRLLFPCNQGVCSVHPSLPGDTPSVLTPWSSLQHSNSLRWNAQRTRALVEVLGPGGVSGLSVLDTSGNVTSIVSLTGENVTGSTWDPTGTRIIYAKSNRQFVLNDSDAYWRVYSVAATPPFTSSEIVISGGLTKIQPRFATPTAVDISTLPNLVGTALIDGAPMAAGTAISITDRFNNPCASGTVGVAGFFALTIPASCVSGWLSGLVGGYRFSSPEWFGGAGPGSLTYLSLSFTRPKFQGMVTISGVPAPDGTVVQFKVGTTDCGSTQASGGRYTLTVADACPNTTPILGTLYVGGNVVPGQVQWDGNGRDLDVNAGDTLFKPSRVLIDSAVAPDGTAVEIRGDGAVLCGSGATIGGAFSITASIALCGGYAAVYIDGYGLNSYCFTTSCVPPGNIWDLGMVAGTRPYAQGTATLNGVTPPDGTLLNLMVNGAICASTAITGGRYYLTIPGTCPAGNASLSIHGGIGATFWYSKSFNGQYTVAVNATDPVNPAPWLRALSPAAANLGGPAFMLTVIGTDFVSSSTVRWNGEDRATAFVDSSHLTAAINASDIATARTADVTVFTPAPGGGTSNSLPFVVAVPPVITSVDPGFANVPSGPFTLTVNGTGFVSSSTVMWNNSPRSTLFVGPTQLAATIPASDTAYATTAVVAVLNGAGNMLCPSVNFEVRNPLPSLSSLSVNSVPVGSGAFALTVNGTNFLSNSTVRWNGSDRSTLYVTATQLTAAISAADVANTGTAIVTVHNVSPGGGESSALLFSIGAPAPNTRWYFAEGFTDQGWSTELHLLNPNSGSATVAVTYLLDSGPPVVRNVTIAGKQKLRLLANDPAVGPGLGAAFGVSISSSLPIVAEEQMSTGSSGDFAHGTSGSTSLSNTWYFAEGYTVGAWQTFVLVANPGPTAADVTLTYQLQAGGAVTRTVSLAAGRRTTFAGQGDVPQQAFSVSVSSTQPVVAEMAMYDPTTSIAHRTVGVTAPATSWYLGEGFTGGAWQTFISVGNPSNSDAMVTATYNIDGEASQQRQILVPAHSRGTFIGQDPVTGVGPGKAFGVKVTSTAPVVVQEVLIDPTVGASRANSTMAVPGLASTWSFSGGSSEAGMVTFITVANPGSTSATVSATYYFNDGTAPVVLQLVIPAQSRGTFVSTAAGISAGKSFGVVIQSTGAPVVASEAVYDEPRHRAYSAGGLAGP